MLGGSVAAQGRYEDAERLLLESYRKLLADRGTTNDKTRDARRRLAEMYTAWGRNAEAAKHTGQ